MHVRQQIVTVSIPPMVLDIVAVAPQAFKGTHTSFMVAKILMSAKLQIPCIHTNTCQNFVGGFNCSCPKGFKGDGKKNGTGCPPRGEDSIQTAILGVSLLHYVST
uniref:NOTCH1 EGF-like calcium-binding domain-containing protein n=1 Tax=Fagus sylvatica TaxID=28930 RepID=A0A2N9F2V7_FAGSY